MGDEVVGIDLAKVRDSNGKHLVTLGWGDTVDVVRRTDEGVHVTCTYFRELSDGSLERVEDQGIIRQRPGDPPVVVDKAEANVLQVDFVDVQQGDGAVIETPQGKVMLVDGGDNQLFARYLAGRYPGTSDEHPKEIDSIVISHGDADHFSGLTEIFRSETNETDWKRLFIHPQRVFHNGLVKRPSKKPPGSETNRPEKEMFGKTVPGPDDSLLITDLVQDVSGVADEHMNKDFVAWKQALQAFADRGEIDFRSLSQGDDDAFEFLHDEGIDVKVLGPILTTVGQKTGLKFLGEPHRKAGHPSENETTFSGFSASHTINGHSIVFRLTFGDWSFLFAGDLNEEAESDLVKQHSEHDIDLRSEVLKVPHHGSADFLHAFLESVKPVVSVVSSGDENESKEYIHPRATLMSALGKYGRPSEPTLFVTELVAFFKAEGFVRNRPPQQDGWAERQEDFFAFSRAAFGIIRVRTNGRRLLVFTNSGQDDLKEAYAYTLKNGRAMPQPLDTA